MRLKKRKESSLFSIISLCFICAAFFSVAHALNNKVLLYGAIAFYLLIMVSAQVNMILPMMLFFIPWSTIIKLSPGSITFYTVATIIVFTIYIFRNLNKFVSIYYYVISLLLIIETLFAKIIHNYSVSKSYFMFFFMLIIFPIYIYIDGKNINFESCVVFFSFGIISAAAAAYWLMNYGHMRAYIDVYNWDTAGLTRLSGFYGDANFYSAQIITAIGGLLVSITLGSKRNILNFILLFALITCGLISVSKSFLISLIIVIVLLFLIIILKKAKIEYKISILLGIVFSFLILLWSGIFNHQINQYLIRFGMVDSASSLTTGRSDIWMDYFRYFKHDFVGFILGQGYSFDGVTKGSHNTLIQIVFQFGAIGAFILVLWLKRTFSCCKKVAKSNLMLLVLLLFSCFFMWFGLDIISFDDFFITICFSIVGINYIASSTDKPIEARAAL